MALWTGQAIAAATGGRLARGFEATGVSIDSRTLQPGDLFVALTDVRDGHDFVRAALDKGASGALVSRVPDGCGADDPLVPKDGGEDTAATIPGAELHLIPGMGHNLPAPLIVPVCDLIERATARARELRTVPLPT